MTPGEYKAHLYRTMSEKVFQQQVVSHALSRGYRVYHTYDSRRSDPGYPDLTMVRRGRLIFAELKSHKGRPTVAQKEWMSALRDVPGIEVYLWRPSDMDDIIDILA